MSEHITPPFDSEISLDSIIINAQKAVNSTLSMPPRSSSLINAPVFVVGCPRSGTTVLGRCLGAHTKCVTAEESLVMLPLWKIYIDLYAQGLPTGVAHLSEYLDNNELVDALGNFSDSVFNGLLTKNNKEIYVDHTPWYGVISPFIQGLNDARFIHIVRDGRQVVHSLTSSYLKGYTWAGKSMEERINIWRQVTLSTDRFLKECDTNVYTVYYNDLCKRPEEVLKGVSSFLGISYETDTILPLEIPHASSDKNAPFGKSAIYKNYSSNGWPYIWKEEERQLFRFHGGEAMDILFGLDWDKSKGII